MRVIRCTGLSCGRPFQVNKFGSECTALGERGKVICPHCNLVVTGEPEFLFITHALSASQEAEFNDQSWSTA
jgi:hypothetical protein